MDVPACHVLAETAHLDVGRGFVVEVRSIRVGEGVPCELAVASVVRARVEGHGAPELLAYRLHSSIRPETKETKVGSVTSGGWDVRTGDFLGNGRSAAPILSVAGNYRLEVLLRGGRTAFASFASLVSGKPATGKASPTRVSMESVWPTLQAEVRSIWVDRGLPLVLVVDPTLSPELRLGRSSSMANVLANVGDAASGRVVLDLEHALLVDAGAPIGGDLSGDLGGDLARGGARMVSALLGDGPLAVVNAADAGLLRQRLQLLTRAGVVSLRSDDPLLQAVGVQLLRSIASGFAGCLESVSLKSLGISTDVRFALTDGDGCPEISDLQVVRDVDLLSEGAAAVKTIAREASISSTKQMESGWPKVGQLISAAGRVDEKSPKVLIPRRIGRLRMLGISTLVLFAFLLMFSSFRRRVSW